MHNAPTISWCRTLTVNTFDKQGDAIYFPNKVYICEIALIEVDVDANNNFLAAR